MKRAALILVAIVAAVGCGSASNTQFLPVGSRCSADSQCGTAPYRCTIAGYPFGYCDKPCSLDSECPADSLCNSAIGGCRRTCSDDATCRVSEGYSCQPLEGRGACDVAPTVDGGQP